MSEEEVNIEWQYLLVLIVAVIFGVEYYFTSTLEISPVHVLFLLGGAILTALILIFTTTQIKSLQPSSFLLQTAIGNVLLGFPLLLGKAPFPLVKLRPTELLVAIASEEAFRIGSAIWLINTWGKGFGLTMSAIVFAAMHIYWYPAQWLFAIVGGFLLSALLVAYGSTTASLLTHFLYDLASLGMISTLVFFGLSAAMGIIGYGIRLKLGR